MTLDHPIFLESIRRIQADLGKTGLSQLEQKVLERLIHSSGDFSIQSLLRFSPKACEIGLSALISDCPIITDTRMASVAISPMAQRTLSSHVCSVLEFAPSIAPKGATRTAIGMQLAWQKYTSKSLKYAPLVVIGSSPTALIALLDLVDQGAKAPSLIIGMPVGFVGVLQSKQRLFDSGIPYISLVNHRGGAGLASAAVNALLRAAK